MRRKQPKCECEVEWSEVEAVREFRVPGIPSPTCPVNLIGSGPFSSKGLANSTDPTVQRFKDCVYGGEDFLKSLLAMAGGEDADINARRVCRTKAPSAHQIIGIVAERYAVDASGYREFRSPASGRDLAAYLCRR